MSCKNCGCTDRHQTVEVKIDGLDIGWVDSLSYDPADAAKREVELYFQRGLVALGNGDTVTVLTRQDGKESKFLVERRDVVMFDSKEV